MTTPTNPAQQSPGIPPRWRVIGTDQDGETIDGGTYGTLQGARDAAVLRSRRLEFTTIWHIVQEETP